MVAPGSFLVLSHVCVDADAHAEQQMVGRGHRWSVLTVKVSPASLTLILLITTEH